MACWRCSASASSAWACCCSRFGTPLVSATRGALIGVLQTPLGTLWVWLAFAEPPAMLTLVGGAIVLAAVVADMVAPTHEFPSERGGARRH